jgi:hypothetical protein
VGSNRGFWQVVISLAVGGIALVLLVIAFRPFARSGAVAYAQSNLTKTAAAARAIAEEKGTLAEATALGLRSQPDVSDLLMIDPDTSSNDPEIISVYARRDSWTGAARADTGECYWIRIEADGTTVRGTGTDCRAENAAKAPAGAWPTL